MDKKTVACLYRVSTMSQVDKSTNDIPMQQNACRDFIKAMDTWSLSLEYTERGVSGYKKSAEERDVLMRIKKDAEKGLFDVLLVFMFDRLGRREDETPFILEWLVSRGIEVWSVKEGQQRFDTRADKLINYIRFWQSGGESEKTGLRVREKHTQMIKAGEFCGGCAPYGYKLIKSGRENEKGRRLKKMEIMEDEAEVVKLIYCLAAEKGYGGQRIAAYLNEKAIPSRKNSKWGITTVNYMLRNPIYKGYPAYGKTTAKSGSNRRLSPEKWHVSEVLVSELAIIDEETWDKVQAIRTSRTPKCFKAEHYGGPNYPMQTKSPMLFTGFIKCGYCGSTLCAYTAVSKWMTKDGEKRRVRPSYRCTAASRGIKCEGQITYARDKIEAPVIEQIYIYLENLEKIDLTGEIEKEERKYTQELEKRLRAIKVRIKAIEGELEKLNGEIGKAVSGESFFTCEQLSKAITQHELGLKQYKEEEAAILAKRSSTKEIGAGMYPSWSEEFANAPYDVKKMLLWELIEEITVFRDKLEISFRFGADGFIK